MTHDGATIVRIFGNRKIHRRLGVSICSPTAITTTTTSVQATSCSVPFAMAHAATSCSLTPKEGQRAYHPVESHRRKLLVGEGTHQNLAMSGAVCQNRSSTPTIYRSGVSCGVTTFTILVTCLIAGGPSRAAIRVGPTGHNVGCLRN